MRPTRFRAYWAVCVMFCCLATSARAQDLYDTTVLRTFALTFHDADWLELLEDNYQSQTNILADLVVEGVTYPDVGVRIRGNTSYTSLPSNSVKYSLNIEVDFVNDGQEVMGYDSLNLNNGHRDPTFCREVVYNNYVAQFIPNPRANHVVVTLNGENWGVYNNVQQFDKTMLSPHYADSDGLRIKCANNPNGPGLRYAGENPGSYGGYEIKNDGGLTDPWGALIDVCWAVTNGTDVPSIDALFAVDPSCWSVALENMLTDDDSYVHKGADFMTYRDPVDERMFLLQTDANETFTQTNWSPTLNFSASNKPVLSHVIADFPEARARYMAHFRTVMENLSWEYFEPIFMAHRDLISGAVLADDKRLYSYQDFLDNFTMTVNLGGGGPGGGNLIGIQPFVEQRAAYLASHAELNGSAPAVSDVTVSDESPEPEDVVTVTAMVTPGDTAIESVDLYYRGTPGAVYQSAPMADQGGGLFSAVLPVTAQGGQVVSFYVGATSSDTYGSMGFGPERTEWDPITIEYSAGSVPGMRITEWMYSGTNEEFVEFTNWSDSAVDMSGYSFDDANQLPGAFDLSAFGVVEPYESVILTEGIADSFRVAWGLDASVKIIGELGVLEGNNLGRNDEINLYDATSTLVDRLTYGDEDFPETIRTRDASGQACCQTLGQNDVTAWVLSVDGDSFGSWTSTGGDVGTPGAYDVSACGSCDPADVDPWLDVSRGGALSAPWPNPFRSSVDARFRIEQSQQVRIVVHDVTGREVRRLVDGLITAGEHVVAWDGNDTAGRPVTSGVYFMRMSSADGTTTQAFVRVQ